MIKLYREKISAQADTIEAEFRELALGYDRVVLDSNEAAQLFDGSTLPVITDNERVVSGGSIPAYIKELEQWMRDWQSFQGDYCYVDGDGETC
jgi:hypothetical protein